MKKNLLLLTLLVSSVSFVLAQETCTYPATTTASVRFRKILHPFTVDAKGTRVLFAPGNLQYQASTGTWRFAAHQYDYIGNAPGNSVTDNAVRDTQSVWIDLLVWGQTGYESTDPSQIYTTSNTSYKPDGPAFKANIANTGYDWGVYCNIWYNEEKISKGTYRTLTEDEWKYLLNNRKHRSDGTTPLYTRRVYVYLNGNTKDKTTPGNEREGVLFYPDDYEESLVAENAKITLTEWNALERQGVVFLPRCGCRNGSASAVGTTLNPAYWSVTGDVVFYGTNNNDQPSLACGPSSTLFPNSPNYNKGIYGSASVRLVKNY
ncbi:MAG: hypothetical protein KBS42_04495 [Bacteroidales bacterium]|nr:hypothetical protein [Candidatus Colicola coprequi]